jgi:hypothetical protein
MTPFVALSNEPSFGSDLKMIGQTAFVDFPWLLAPLMVLVFILIILAGLTLFEIPMNLLNKLNEAFSKRITPKISE